MFELDEPLVREVVMTVLTDKERKDFIDRFEKRQSVSPRQMEVWVIYGSNPYCVGGV